MTETTGQSRWGCMFIFFVVLFLLLFMVVAFLNVEHKKRVRKPNEEACYEALENLEKLYYLQEKYRDYTFGYAGTEEDGTCFEQLGFNPEEVYYSYYCGVDSIRGSLGKDCNYEDYNPVGDRHFKIVAVANLDDDPVCDVWTVNQKGEIINVVDDLAPTREAAEKPKRKTDEKKPL